MPLVRISLREGKSAEYRAAVGEAVHRAMIETINVPEHDRFQIFSEHAPSGLVFDAGYLGIDRSENLIIIQITLNAGRTLEQKRALYRVISENLARDAGVRPQDVLVSLVEVSKENWSFGNGEASYAKERET